VVYRGLELSELELSIGWMLGREFLSLVQMTEQDAGAPSQQKGTTPRAACQDLPSEVAARGIKSAMRYITQQGGGRRHGDD
jgi:hypothetical protein